MVEVVIEQILKVVSPRKRSESLRSRILVLMKKRKRVRKKEAKRRKKIKVNQPLIA